ncbi:DUF4157 domain-containing protein [Pedobacter gandavensis]|uniref:eCIS core domain-containing protein n=1 Tax=Pedobacter gandavensis TaxID=2679963 RepID=UPI00292D4E98|nr:DUF4157 domain-containing protein [Pedobacter gandavensis]
MNRYADKTTKTKNQGVANSLPRLQVADDSTFQLVNNRIEAVSQQKLQEAITNNTRKLQLKTYSEMPDNFSSETAQLNKNLEGGKKNNTGLPDNLKSGLENLSGYNMDDVKVHRNSDKPAQLQAHAYAQGTDIHLGPGKEKHLAHEAWHVVQQKQGRVKPTLQMKGKININDDTGLEKEADVMAIKVFQFVDNRPKSILQKKQISGQLKNLKTNQIIQRNNFSDTLPIEDDNLSPTEGLNLKGIPANMKRIVMVSGESGNRYVTARGNKGASVDRLTPEANHLQELRAARLEVPKVYKKNTTPPENISGVISEDVEEPFIIMEFIPGKFVDVWKAPGSLNSAIAVYFKQVQADEKSARADKVKEGIQSILSFLKTHLVVDLQLIIESDTGRVVIIDPAAIYPTSNAEKMVEHGSSYRSTINDLEKAIIKLDAIITPPALAERPPMTKETLEELFEEVDLDNDLFKERIRSRVQETDPTAGEEDVELEVSRLIELSGCI